MRPGEIRSTISEKLPEARQHLARALRALYDCTAVQGGRRISQAELCRKADYVGKPNLCRYLKGENVPSEAFVEAFYVVISNITDTLPLTREELLVMRKEAEAADGRRREARRGGSARELDDAHREIEDLRRQVDELAIDRAEPVALPVPLETRDRQRNEFAERPVPEAAIEAIRLAERGQDEQTVTLLSRLSEHLDANELALCVTHFRAQHNDDLADTLIHIYGRDHREDLQQGVRLSIALRKHQLHDDADALLKMIIDSEDD
ncbi:hypothetical protein [Kibdelosporangium aridum]|uniref:hypothetical protein n=1 Tax=Kibdelosporangium aridum TaxID=2030 RepID=UPI000525B500